MGDHWGETTVEVDGKPAYTQKYHESDGARFLSKGPERTMTVEVHDRELAERAIKERMRPEVAEDLLQQLAKGDNHLSVYLNDAYEDDTPRDGIPVRRRR